MEAHELADLIPPMTDEEYEKLKEDIAKQGLLDPIVLYENRILDGRNRYRACRELGITPDSVYYKGDDPARFVVAKNIHRRHLTIAQRAEVALALMPHYRKEHRKNQLEGLRQGTNPAAREPRSGQSTHTGDASNQDTITDNNRARDDAAQVVGVGGATVYRLGKVAEEAPDLHEQVKSGEKTINAAYQEHRERKEGKTKTAKKPKQQAIGSHAYEWGHVRQFFRDKWKPLDPKEVAKSLNGDDFAKAEWTVKECTLWLEEFSDAILQQKERLTQK